MALDLAKALERKSYNSRECDAAIKGEKVPAALGLPISQWCVVRGIRHHHGFAKELRGTLPLFTRALNARDIMSNIIPEMTSAEEVPYCIWYPDVASEDTYRSLATRYPELKYHVGRACAVAGYTALYNELALLPEVSIAEEARESAHLEIYDAIMADAVKYKVLDDYSRTANLSAPTQGAHLNGDTCVIARLSFKQNHSHRNDFAEGSFDITEDKCIDVKDSPGSELPVADTNLLYTPLPLDLPTVHKDLLILMAAYYGDVDRYSRLRRPRMIENEINCVVRGIYHNTLFAKWWSLQQASEQEAYASVRIRKAINARFIMNNDLSCISGDTPASDIPYTIWYPHRANWKTYEELARRRPDLKQQAARACIVAGYESSFDRIKPEVDEALIAEAKASSNGHFLRLLEERASQQVGAVISVGSQKWKLITSNEISEPTSTWLPTSVRERDIGTSFDYIYDGMSADVSTVELKVCAAKELTADGSVDITDLYEGLVT